MRIIVGPALCHECKQPVYWADVKYGRTPGRAWRNADGTMHRCAK
jgi:hypothetical protein